MAEELQVVNNRDEPSGRATRVDAWKHGHRLRMVRVVLTDGEGRILVQKRDPHSSSYPNRWTDAATGHVNADEDYVSAAHRELEEELGVDVDLTFLGNFSLSERGRTNSRKTFNAVFIGVLPRRQELSLEAGAVSTVRWLQVDELCRRACEEPSELTPGLVKTVSHFLARDSLPTYVGPQADRWGVATGAES